MTVCLNSSTRALYGLMLAIALLFAQQAAQLHALAHAQDQIAHPQKGKPASHPIEQCVAFHAIDSALVASAALLDFDFLRSERVFWFASEATAPTAYRHPARAPPRGV